MRPQGDGGVCLEGVSKRYGSETVVRNVSLTIAAGEFYTLLGPSGSGKTTTLSMIAGFILPDAGRILIDGKDATRMAPRDRGLGMVFQNYAIFPHLDVAENVAFPLRVRKAPKAEIARRVAEALEVVKLTGFEARHVRQLSGGQQQRVALARAIVSQPRVVLMDEPLGALDKNLRYHMQVEIKEISRRLGMTVVYVTHDQEQALTMSDRIAIMHGGRIAQMGPPRDVYERPDSPFVARFLGEANLIRASREGDTLHGVGGAVFEVSNVRQDLKEGVVFVRPEKMTLLERGDGQAANRLVGTVRHVAFLGNVVRYEMTLGDGQSVLCDATNAPGTMLLKAGDRTDLAWRAEDALIMDV